jgi:hypothetical protein
MTTYEASPDTSLETTPLLDTDPAISFDIDFKDQLKPGQVIDVDYPALRESIQLLDGPVDNSNLSMIIRTKRGLDRNTAGFYNRKDAHIEVAFKREKSAQKTIQHELRHYTDMIQNPVSTPEMVGNLVGNLAGSAVTPTTIGNVGLLALKEVLHTPGLDHAASQIGMDSSNYGNILSYLEFAQQTSSAISLGVIALHGVFYYGNKRERTARKAERVKAPRILTVSTTK